jgi:L-fuconolactonase
MTTPVVDSHHHFWDPARREYPWMIDELATIRRPFGPRELAPLIAANGVDRTVLIQTVSSLDETQEFLTTAERTDFIAGVVGWVDLTDPKVSETLSQLKMGPGGNYLVGIRHQAHDEVDARWLLRDDVLHGIRAVGDAGLAYDFLVRTREMPAALHVARRFPDIRFVIDHMAKPRVGAGARDLEWEAALAGFSDLPNVTCKLSGLVTEARWNDWTPTELAPYVRRAVGWFGPERCMFGSDWPVCLLAASYEQVTQVARYSLRDLKSAEMESVFGSNAIRVYGLVG